MKPDEVRKLLGGYATGTLTEAERNLLYAAALEDQELFEALADEEVLRAYLSDAATRESLIGELQRRPALDAWLAEDRRVPAHLASHSLPAPSQALPREMKVVRPFWSRMRDGFTAQRWAVAGGLAMIILIAGGILYIRSRGQDTTTVAMVNPVNPAPERAPVSVGQKAAPQIAARDQEPAPKQVAARRSENQQAAVQSADAKLSEAGEAKQKPAQADSAELDRTKSRNDDNRVAVAASASARDSVIPEQKAEKETAASSAAREELNQAVRQQVAQERSKENGSVESSAPPAAAAAPPNSGNLAVRPAQPATPAQIVAGGLSRAAAPLAPARKAAGFGGQPRQAEGKVTDINGTIVSINVGSNEGFYAGDLVEIVRDNRVLATSKLSQVGSTFAVGPFQLAAGSNDTPRTGDMVRRAAASQPQR